VFREVESRTLRKKTKRKALTQRTQRAQRSQRRVQERRGNRTSDRKSPPFPPEAGEGWGTLKFTCEETS